jgi:polysaccharide deacetylase family protein (PEP-CTERM system associated)
MKEIFPLENWHQCEQRIEQGMDFLLLELGRRKIKATFFILGWIAEKKPELIKRIEREGHEVGGHSYSHRSITSMSRDELYHDLKKGKEIVEAIINKSIEGFRAPSFSITKKTLWALDVINQVGFSYDSSIYPTVHPNYGIPDFPPYPQKIKSLQEIPMSVVKAFFLTFPISGGGPFRLYPYFFYKFLLKKALATQDVIIYFHPWEFDPEQPKMMSMSWFKRFRHYTGLKGNRRKFLRLLNDFSFREMKDYRDHWFKSDLR